jgi:hypothetical protein
VRLRSHLTCRRGAPAVWTRPPPCAWIDSGAEPRQCDQSMWVRASARTLSNRPALRISHPFLSDRQWRRKPARSRSRLGRRHPGPAKLGRLPRLEIQLERELQDPRAGSTADHAEGPAVDVAVGRGRRVCGAPLPQRFNPGRPSLPSRCGSSGPPQAHSVCRSRRVPQRLYAPPRRHAPPAHR